MKKKKTKKKVISPIPPTITISDSSFYGVSWDKPSLEVLADVAKGLLNLSELFKSQNVSIGSLLTINPEKSSEDYKLKE